MVHDIFFDVFDILLDIAGTVEEHDQRSTTTDAVITARNVNLVIQQRRFVHDRCSFCPLSDNKGLAGSVPCKFDGAV